MRPADERVDDRLVVLAMCVTFALCLPFRYLPMTALPQHEAMVSIFLHSDDPDYGFGDRFTIDLISRPYATVYVVATVLGAILPLRVAMHVTVGICTVAPIFGLWLLLRAAGRPRVHALLAVPLAFGHLWHWGFLNLLLGAGLLSVGLALVVRAAATRSRWMLIWLLVVGMISLGTHPHTFAALVLLAPAFAWGFRAPNAGRLDAMVPLAALAPAGIAGVAIALTSWRAARGFGPQQDLGPIDRILSFPDLLGAGLLPPWPIVLTSGLAAIAVLTVALAIAARRRGAGAESGPIAPLAVAAAVHALLYLALPLQTPSASYVFPREALLLGLAIPTLLPRLAGRARSSVRVAIVLFAAGSLVTAGVHLAAFDREARDLDPILSRVPMNSRIASLVFDPSSEVVHPRLPPYLQVAAYAQAARGGDLSSSFASHWNIPVHYRRGARTPMPPNVEWEPWRLTARDLATFDVLLVRGRLPPPGLPVIKASGTWALVEAPAPPSPEAEPAAP